MKNAVILCSSFIDLDVSAELSEDTILICADGGWEYAAEMGLTPDIIIGDCDSASKPYPEDIPHRIYPSEKDDTDAALCVDYAIEQGCTDILLLGATGGRLDHEYANYNLLLYGLKKCVRIRLADACNEIWMENKPFHIRRSEKKYLSFFPFCGTVDKLTIKGLKYTAENLRLDAGSTLTCGNEFDKEDEAYISFDKGVLLVMRCNDRRKNND